MRSSTDAVVMSEEDILIGDQIFCFWFDDQQDPDLDNSINKTNSMILLNTNLYVLFMNVISRMFLFDNVFSIYSRLVVNDVVLAELMFSYDNC